MAILNKEQILGADDLKREVVPVPEWGKDMEVIVSEMSAEAADAWASETYVVKGDDVVVKRENYQARALVFCLVDEQGERLFGIEEAASLGRKSAKALARLFSVADKLNGFTPKRKKEAKKN